MTQIDLPWPLRLYRGATYALEPVAAATLRWRERKGKEDPAGSTSGADMPRCHARKARWSGPMAQASARRSRSCR